jgi:hypothetical protein
MEESGRSKWKVLRKGKGIDFYLNNNNSSFCDELITHPEESYRLVRRV